jgi:hypothetical protein
VDGHSFVAPDYLSRIVAVMRETGESVVGGPVQMLADTPFRRALIEALYARIAVGSVPYRTLATRADVESLQTGSFRREVLDRVGTFDEALAVVEDLDMNTRIRKAGYALLLDPSIRFWYVPRSSLSALWRQIKTVGLVKARILRKHPDIFKWKYVLPTAFVILFVGAILAAIAYQESGSALVWAERRRKAQIAAPNPGPALIVADPDYGTVADSVSSLRSAEGPVVVRVQRGGAAARAGVRVGDVITSISGSSVARASDVGEILRANPGRPSTDFVVKRCGAERAIRLGPGDPGMEIAPSLPAHLSEPSARTRAQPLEPLPGTAREAEEVRIAIEGQGTEIQGVARSVVLLRGEEATESLLAAWAPEAAILHIAAHQIPDPAGCSDSGRLALTTPLIPTAEDDGFLDLNDLLLHWRGRLERCELAVLSSCWSRTGRLEREEGFFGLPLGLRFAGCPSIVASLWPVDDAVTASLMTTFYRNLEKPGDSGRLRAFLDARRSVKREYADPYYWAAFVWSGAPR